MAATDPVLAVSMVWFEIALVIFVVVFLAITVWVLLSRSATFRRAARIPLDDDVVTPRSVVGTVEDDNVGNDQR